jgi:hypothetical protein
MNLGSSEDGGDPYGKQRQRLESLCEFIVQIHGIFV